jgi:hypothetical protein
LLLLLPLLQVSLLLPMLLYQWGMPPGQQLL